MDSSSSAAAASTPTLLGTSPRSSMFYHPPPVAVALESSSSEIPATGEISLEEFVAALPGVIGERKKLGVKAGSPEDPVQNLFE